MLARVRPEFRWYRHLKEPTCVVGEHKQLALTLVVFLRETGEDGCEDDGRVTALMSSRHRVWTVIFGVSGLSPFFDSSDILVIVFLSQGEEIYQKNQSMGGVITLT